MTWSPEKRMPVPSSAKAAWFAACPGVRTAVSAQPSPSIVSPSLTAISGTKAGIRAFGKRIDLAVMQRPRRPVRPFADGLCAGLPLQPCGKRRVVAMRMGDEDMRDRPARERLHQRLKMRLVLRPRIDDRDG